MAQSIKTILSLLLFTAIVQNNLAQNLTVSEINKKLGKGMNMGNMFEAPSETAWGNPFQNDYFERISQLGFNSVRVPIRWDVPDRALQTSPYTVSPVFLARIKTIVDNAIANKLYVIINMHHHEEIFTDPEKVKPRFLSQWEQIATYFKDYNQSLLFEIMNEPHDKLTPELWNTFMADALKSIRKTNPTRAVLVGPGDYNGLGAIPKLKLPDDKNLILSIHYYNPFQFTHQGAEWIGGDANSWLGTKWEDLEMERNQVESEFSGLKTFLKQNDIPVNIGEFGAYSKADIASRNKWTTFLARWFELRGYSWNYWEFSAGFGIYDPATKTYRQSLVDALIKNPLPNAVKLPTKELYKSNFSSDIQGWAVSVQPGSQAVLTNPANLVIDVKTAVANGWHVQLTKTDITIENKKRYLVTIRGFADKNVGATNYIGRASGDYASYSGYPSLPFGTEEKDMTYIFTMNQPTDNKARMSFDMGTAIAKFTITSVKIEEILENVVVVTPVVLANEEEINDTTLVSPNPTSGILRVDNLEQIDSITMMDITGNVFLEKNVKGQKSIELDLSNKTTGTYLLRLKGEKKEIVRKVLKR
ncbi:MAG: cellulase family glycosylhydrolase [Arcicella sp.]|nr:cellulase family glycosylhydrolase [Arcicella sp.]